MNIITTISPHVGNKNKTEHDFKNEESTGRTSRMSKSQLEINQKEHTSIISQYSSLDTEHDDIHDRSIRSKGTESYLTEPECSQPPFNEHIDNSTQHNSENTKITSDTKQWPSFPETVNGLFTSLVSPIQEHGFKSFHWNPQPKIMAASLFNLCFPSLSIMGTFALTIITLTRSAGASKSDGTTTSSLSDSASPQNIIGINNLDTLMKIGNHADYPTNGNYRLTADIDASQLKSQIKTFTGSFDGDGYTISNLPCCLIETITGGSVVKNITINNANIRNEYYSAVLVHQARDNSSISYIQVKNCNIYSDSTSHHPIGVVAEVLSESSKIENSLVKNCTLTTHGTPSGNGLIAGLMYDNGKSIGNIVVDCEIISHGSHASSGCIAGYMYRGSQSTGDRISHCNITSHNLVASTACVVGKLRSGSQISNNDVSYCNIITNVADSHAGIAAGEASFSNISNNTLSESTSSAFGNNSLAAIGVATPSVSGKLFDNTAINCIAIANGSNSRAGVWSADINNRAIHNSNVAINCTPEVSWKWDEMTTTTATATTESSGGWGETNRTASLAVEPEIVDHVSFLPIGLLIAGAVTSIGVVVCFSRSLYRAYQEGQTGLDLAKYPFKSFGKWLADCSPSHSYYQPQQEDEEIFELDIIYN